MRKAFDGYDATHNSVLLKKEAQRFLMDMFDLVLAKEMQQNSDGGPRADWQSKKEREASMTWN